MPLEKAFKKALKALSREDVKSIYKLKRAEAYIKAPHVTRPIYKLWDKKILSGDREIALRLYPAPRGCHGKMILFFHGGGWVTESVDTYNSLCKSLAKYFKCKVASVDYRLAPEFPFPMGFDDCYEVAKLVYNEPQLFDAKHGEIVMMGDSAGGNLAAAVALKARDTGDFKIPTQVLIYPAVFNNHTPSSPFKSVTENGTDYLLTAKAVRDYMELYKGKDEDYNNPYFAPLLTKDFTDLPNTLVITAELDPLRDEGEEYAKRLKLGGNTVELFRMKDSLHGFFSMGLTFMHVRRAYEIIENFLSR